jgi:hypothetical protein
MPNGGGDSVQEGPPFLPSALRHKKIYVTGQWCWRPCQMNPRALQLLGCLAVCGAVRGQLEK